jgi:hypothetical protein
MGERRAHPLLDPGHERRGLRERERGADLDRELRIQPVPDPARPHIAHAQHAGSRRGLGQGLHGPRLHGVHEPLQHRAHRADQYQHHHRRDQQADQRVDPGQSGPGPEHADDDGQRGHRVGAGVLPLRDQRRRADPSARPDAIARHELVPGRADQGRGEHPAQVSEVARRGQRAHRLPHDERGRERDDGPDEQADQVLRAAEAVAVPGGGGAAAQPERDDQRDRGGEVTEVVHGVRQQGDGAGERDDHDLQQRGRPHAGEAHPGGAESDRAGLLGGADRLAVVVAVGCEGVAEPAPCGRVVVVVVVVLVLVGAVVCGHESKLPAQTCR